MKQNVIRPDMDDSLERQSWIRRMFEAAGELKARVGAENVFDFSLGNPDLPAPGGVGLALRELADEALHPRRFGYVPNAGLPELRTALAEHISQEQETAVPAARVMVTCGAAGAINALFRTVLEPDDEVLCSAPFFAEYEFYVSNFGARLRPVPSRGPSFDLNLEAIAEALNPHTRAVLINAPNNPTGRIYPKQDLKQLAALLQQHNESADRPVYLVSDEPYRFLTYGEVKIPAVMPLYPYTIVVSSFSKSLSLAGARIGYLAAHPELPGGERLMRAVIMANRILGYVNAPVMAQHVLLRCLGQEVDVSRYDTRREVLSSILRDAGMRFSEPEGAFYFFPQVPEGVDEMEFLDCLLAENIIAVPGRGFGGPGHVRLSFCLPVETIERSREAFVRAAAVG